MFYPPGDVMKKRRDVGDLSFTEEERQELLKEEEKERSAKSEASRPAPESEAQASLFGSLFRSVWSRK